jgi:hypothetical protein
MSQVFGVEFERRCLLPLIVTRHAILGKDGLNLLLRHCRNCRRLLQTGPGKSGVAGDASKTQSANGYDQNPAEWTHTLLGPVPSVFE